MSSDLTWLITRNTSSFAVKRNGIILNKQSISGRHSLKETSTKYVSVVPAAKGVTIKITRGKVPAHKVSKAALATTFKGPAKSAAKKINNLVRGYRADLAPAVVARATKIIASQTAKPKKIVKKVRGKN